MTLNKYLCGMVAAAGILMGNYRVEANNRLNAVCKESLYSGKVICLPTERFEVHGEQRFVQDGDKTCQYYSSFQVRDTWEETLESSVKEISYALKKEAERGGLFEERGCSTFTLEYIPWMAVLVCKRDKDPFRFMVFPPCEFSATDDDIVLKHFSYSASEKDLAHYPPSRRIRGIREEYKFDVDSHESAVYFAGKLDEMRGILEMMLRHGISKETIEAKLSAEKEKCEKIAGKNE